MISYESLVPFGNVDDGVLYITDSFSVECTEHDHNDCTLVSALSAYKGDSAPKIQYILSVPDVEKPAYMSHKYSMGKKESCAIQKWRVPPLFLPEMSMTLRIEIPEGTVLMIRSFEATRETTPIKTCGKYRFNAHLGFLAIAPNNTLLAFEMAAKCGFSSCMAAPNVTRDGVLVCIHDDTINKTARDANGEPPKDPIYVRDKTYEELLKWEYGSYRSPVYRGAKLPLLSEFFDICQKTGMNPIFSTHPSLTVEQWNQVKKMLEERNILAQFHIKSFDAEILKTAYSVFGTEIDGYTLDVKKWDKSCIDALLSTGVDVSRCRVGMEVRFDDYTEQIAKDILNAGMFAAAWDIERRDFSEYDRLFSYGVTEFTEDNHCSMGLYC